MSMTRRLCLAVMAAFLVVSLPGPALARRNPEAARLARIGMRQYTRGSFGEAARAFRAAYAMDPKPLLLFNVGKCLQRQGMYPEAIDAYVEYLEARPQAPNREEVERSIRDLEEEASQSMTKLRIESEPPGAAVFLDRASEALGRTPVLRWFSHGKHRFRVVKSGYQACEREIELGAGGPGELRMELEEEVLPGLSADLAENAPTPGPGSSVGADGGGMELLGMIPTSARIAVGIAAGALAAGIGFGAAARSGAAEAREYSAREDAKRARWDQMIDDARGHLLICNIALGTATASAAVAGVLIRMHRSGGQEPGEDRVPVALLLPLEDGAVAALAGRF